MKFSKKMLDEVRVVVSHADCPDGYASAAIVCEAFAHRRLEEMPRFVFARYDAERDKMPAEPGMLFVDMTPPAARAKEFVDAGAIVLDHHKSAREVVEAFGDRGVFADEQTEPGVSGAMLAYRHVFLALHPESFSRKSDKVREFAELAGVRDTWRKEDPRWRRACEQAQVLRLVGERVATDDSCGLFTLAEICSPREGEFDVGKVLLENHEAAARRLAEGALYMDLKGARVALLAGDSHLVSDAADLVDAPVCVGFRYVEKMSKISFSIRSRTPSFDCGAFAKKLGGGGHRGAAGFAVDVEDEAPQTTFFRL